MSASELPSFLAVAGFESEISMAMFVQLLGDEATFSATLMGPKVKMRNESSHQEEEYETEMAWPFRISHRGGRGQDFDRSVSVR